MEKTKEKCGVKKARERVRKKNWRKKDRDKKERHCF